MIAETGSFAAKSCALPVKLACAPGFDASIGSALALDCFLTRGLKWQWPQKHGHLPFESPPRNLRFVCTRALTKARDPMLQVTLAMHV